MSKKQEKRNGGNCNRNPNKKEVVYPTREEALSIETILAEKINELEARLERLEVWMTTPPPASALFRIMCRLAALEDALKEQAP